MQPQIELIETGIILIMGAYNLIFYFQVRRPEYLYIGFLCLAILLRGVLVPEGSMLFYHFFPTSSITLGTKIEYLCSYSCLPFALLSINAMFPFPAFKNVIRGFMVAHLVYLLIVLFTPYHIYTQTVDTNNLLVIASIVLFILILWKAIKKKRPGSSYVLLGLIICSFFIFIEISRLAGVFVFSEIANPINSGFVIFLFFYNLSLSKIFASVFVENRQLNKNLEKKVLEKTLKLQKSNTFKEVLIRILSHDIRGPLSNLKGLVSLTMTDNINMDQAKKLLKNVDKSVDHTMDMLNGLLEWGKASSEREATKTQVQFKDILDEILAPLSIQMKNKNLSFKSSGDIDSICSSDEYIVKVVSRNLISNAIKFTERGGSIELEIEKEREDLRVSVKDTGIGVPDEMKQNLFEMKKNTSRLGTEKEMTSGVGLCICRDLIDHNGGSIKVFDNPHGKGSVFEFKLKQAC